MPAGSKAAPAQQSKLEEMWAGKKKRGEVMSKKEESSPASEAEAAEDTSTRTT